MFDSMVIRKLARSEEMFAETHNFVGLGAHLKGPVDVDALSAAFDALLEAHPVLAGHLERGPDGRHQIVVDDLVHPGTEVVKLDDAAAEPPIHLDQSESLAQLRLTIRDGQAQPTLYIHHSLADGHHQFSLVEELFSYYTDLVCTGRIPSVTVHPAPVTRRGARESAEHSRNLVHDWICDGTVVDSGTIWASDSLCLALRATRFTLSTNRGLNRDPV